MFQLKQRDKLNEIEIDANFSNQQENNKLKVCFSNTHTHTNTYTLTSNTKLNKIFMKMC